MLYTMKDIDWKNSTEVISGAQKFILPVPKFEKDDGGEPLIYPAGHEKAGQKVTDWEGKPIGEKGLVFSNSTDKCFQAAKNDGQSVIIINLVTQEQADKLHKKISDLYTNLDYLSLSEMKEILRYATEDLKIGDMYNSNRDFIGSKMSKIEDKSIFSDYRYGLHKRNDRDICYAVYISGEGKFKGPAATEQKFNDGAIILKQDEDARLIQPDAFEKSYTKADGSKITISDLAVHNAFVPRPIEQEFNPKTR